MVVRVILQIEVIREAITIKRTESAENTMSPWLAIVYQPTHL